MPHKQYIFLGGLPRSGSTLLCNILAQNPEIHATATSSVLDEMVTHLSQAPRRNESRAQDTDENRILRQAQAILDAAYEDVEQPIVVEKSRGWCAYAEMLDRMFGGNFKIIVPLRDVRDILASMEKLWRKKQETDPICLGSNMPMELFSQLQTIEGRLQFWMRSDQVVGLAHNRVRDALNRGWQEHLCMVTYEALTAEPERTLKALYSNLEMESFDNHDFNNVEQVTNENDSIYGFKDLHTIRRKVRAQEPQWPGVLGPVAKPYEKLNFWKE
jgi:sulfotransferase